jgi:hypothetical protein
VASAEPKNALLISLPLGCTGHEASCLIACTYSSSGAAATPKPQRDFYRVTVYRVTDEERFQMMEDI